MNAQQNQKNALIQDDKALMVVMKARMKDDAELFKQFMDNSGFKRRMADTVFSITHNRKLA